MPSSSHHLANIKKLGPGVISSLAKWSEDSLHYKVDVLKFRDSDQKCKVKFEDNYECWLHRNDIHLELALGFIKDDQIVCCICDGGKSEAPNELILCDVCQQGFHLQCHKPNIDRSLLDDENNEWLCSTCNQLCAQSKNVVQDVPKRRAKSVTPKKTTPKKTSPKKTSPKNKLKQQAISKPVIKITNKYLSKSPKITKGSNKQENEVETAAFVNIVADREINDISNIMQ